MEVQRDGFLSPVDWAPVPCVMIYCSWLVILLFCFCCSAVNSRVVQSMRLFILILILTTVHQNQLGRSEANPPQIPLVFSGVQARNRYYNERQLAWRLKIPYSHSDELGQIDFYSKSASFFTKLTLLGRPDLTYEDRVGPRNGIEIYTNRKLGYGSFRFRVRTSPCKDDEEVVTGLFTYSYGGDLNGNHIKDNSEIDIELVCSAPNLLLLSIWTDYMEMNHRLQDDNWHCPDANFDGFKDQVCFSKISRTIDMSTGEYFETEPGNISEMSKEPRGMIEGLPPQTPFAPDQRFYEMGFDWTPNQVRYFIVLDDREVTLWDFRKSQYIPRGPANFRMNLWHPKMRWFDPDYDLPLDQRPLSKVWGDYPKENMVLYVDWFRYCEYY